MYYPDNQWTCWNWIIEKDAWEECEIWDANCNNTCHLWELNCWNWKLDNWEECDFTFYLNQWLAWDDNPCDDTCK